MTSKNMIAQYSRLDVTGDFFRKADTSTLAGSSITDILQRFIPYIFYASGVALLFYFAYGGYVLMVSRGDTKKIQEGKHIITSAITGFIIVFSAYWIVELIGLIFGVGSITSTFRP